MARLDRQVSQRIATLENPRQAGKVLQGRPRRWIYRVGEYRVICDIQDDRLVVLVVEVGHRSRVYR